MQDLSRFFQIDLAMRAISEAGPDTENPERR